jgi:hypothetical protein
MGWTDDESGFDSGWGKSFFLFFIAFRSAPGPTQLLYPEVPWGTGVVFPEG